MSATLCRFTQPLPTSRAEKQHIEFIYFILRAVYNFPLALLDIWPCIDLQITDSVLTTGGFPSFFFSVYS